MSDHTNVVIVEDAPALRVVIDSTDVVSVVEDGSVRVVSVAIQGPTGPQGAQGPQGVQGPQGIQGPTGEALIGGYSVALSNPQALDVLQFGGSAWVNAPQRDLTDGGNF